MSRSLPYVQRRGDTLFFRMRHSLLIEKTIDDTDKELPELVIKELTSAEVEEMRRVGVDEEEEEALA